MKIPHILITGSSGFVGKALVNKLVDYPKKLPCRESFLRGDFELKNIDVVVHLAAHVHVMKYRSRTSLEEFSKINVDGTLKLAQQALAAGVKRFVFISSVKVNGESTLHGRPFSETDLPAPQDPYAQSKYEAEQKLIRLTMNTDMEIVIIRSPLVYGPGVKANFAALMNAVESGWLLPFGAVRNQRSYVAIDNLIDFIEICISHPRAGNQTFFVSDGRDISTPALISAIALSSGVSAHLVSVPIWILKVVATLFGRYGLISRLCGSLQVDISKARNLLGWVPPVSMHVALKRALDYRR